MWLACSETRTALAHTLPHWPRSETPHLGPTGPRINHLLGRMASSLRGGGKSKEPPGEEPQGGTASREDKTEYMVLLRRIQELESKMHGGRQDQVDPEQHHAGASAINWSRESRRRSSAARTVDEQGLEGIGRGLPGVRHRSWASECSSEGSDDEGNESEASGASVRAKKGATVDVVAALDTIGRSSHAAL